jgi:hypothetical protein
MTIQSIKQSLVSKFASAITIVALVGLLVGPSSAIASTTVISAISDTMSTQAPNVTADHTISWTQATGHALTLADTVAVAFTVSGDFTAGGTWQTTDFSLTTSVGTSAPGAVNGACTGSGASNYKVDVTGTVLPVFTITTCTGWTTVTTGSAVTFVIKGATGGTGTLTNKNGDANSSTYTITDTGTNTDTATGVVVVETNDVVTVTGVVAPSLTLAISANALTLSPNPITSAAISTGSHTITTATNAAGGFAISYNGPTLTSGTKTIDPVGATAVTSAPGTEQFGFNLAVTTTTNGSCAADGQYNNATKYAFVASTTTLITNEAAPASCVFTANYGANIAPVTESGTYTSAITFIDTATF